MNGIMGRLYLEAKRESTKQLILQGFNTRIPNFLKRMNKVLFNLRLKKKFDGSMYTNAKERKRAYGRWYYAKKLQGTSRNVPLLSSQMNMNKDVKLFTKYSKIIESQLYSFDLNKEYERDVFVDVDYYDEIFDSRYQYTISTKLFRTEISPMLQK